MTAKKLPKDSAKKRRSGTKKMYCDRCDGCGWYEGGKGAIQTFCDDCKGTGLVPVSIPRNKK